MNIEVEGSVWCNMRGSRGEDTDDYSPEEETLHSLNMLWLVSS